MDTSVALVEPFVVIITIVDNEDSKCLSFTQIIIIQFADISVAIL